MNSKKITLGQLRQAGYNFGVPVLIASAYDDCRKNPLLAPLVNRIMAFEGFTNIPVVDLFPRDGAIVACCDIPEEMIPFLRKFAEVSDE